MVPIPVAESTCFFSNQHIHLESNHSSAAASVTRILPLHNEDYFQCQSPNELFMPDTVHHFSIQGTDVILQCIVCRIYFPLLCDKYDPSMAVFEFFHQIRCSFPSLISSGSDGMISWKTASTPGSTILDNTMIREFSGHCQFSSARWLLIDGLKLWIRFAWRFWRLLCRFLYILSNDSANSNLYYKFRLKLIIAYTIFLSISFY